MNILRRKNNKKKNTTTKNIITNFSDISEAKNLVLETKKHYHRNTFTKLYLPNYEY